MTGKVFSLTWCPGEEHGLRDRQQGGDGCLHFHRCRSVGGCATVKPCHAVEQPLLVVLCLKTVLASRQEPMGKKVLTLQRYLAVSSKLTGLTRRDPSSFFIKCISKVPATLFVNVTCVKKSGGCSKHNSIALVSLPHSLWPGRNTCVCSQRGTCFSELLLGPGLLSKGLDSRVVKGVFWNCALGPGFCSSLIWPLACLMPRAVLSTACKG